MTVGGDYHLVNAVDMIEEVFYFSPEFRGKAVTGGVGDVDDGRACLDYSLDHSCEVLVVGASCVLGVELNILDVSLGVCYCGDCPLKDLFTCGIEFVSYVRIGSPDACMDSGMLGVAKRVGCYAYVVLNSSCEGTYCGPCHSLGYFYH